MKNFKRILATVTIIAIVAMSSMISTFALGTMDATITADTVKAGDVVTVAVEISSLDGAKGTTASVKFDNTAFALPEGDNTAFNFGNAMKKSYYPNYINNAFTARAFDAIKNGGMDLPLTLWQTVSYNATEDEAMLVLVDAAAGTEITSEYEEMIEGPYNVGHFDFIAKEDIAAGSYDFEVKLDVSTAKAGVQTFTETITVTVAGDEFTPETIKGDAIEASATEVVLPKSEGSLNTNTYTNVAVFNAEVAEGISFSEAGFIWVKDTVETEFNYAFDGEAIKGEGSFEYGVVMAGIPSDVTITAIPYYVTAE